MTDGNQTGVDLIPNQTPLVDAIQPIKDLGVKVIAIGIGSVDRNQLATLVTDTNDILQPKSFNELLTLVKTTVGRSCRGMKFIICLTNFHLICHCFTQLNQYSSGFGYPRRIKNPSAI